MNVKTGQKASRSRTATAKVILECEAWCYTFSPQEEDVSAK